MSTKRLTRREFLRASALTTVGVLAAACAPAIPAARPATEPTSASPAATSAPAVKATSGPKYGGTLRIGFADGLDLGYPPDLQRLNDYFNGRPAVESLGRYDDKGQMSPWLAESWKTDANAKTMTITLKKGIKFHDGTDFNAEAVKWNLEQIASSGREELKSVQSVEVVDDSTVRVNLREWDNGIVISVCYFGGPMVSPTAFKAHDKNWAVAHPVGTGPFQFVSWERDVAVKYKKFDGYWQKGKPYLDTLELRVIADPMVALAAYKAHEVDMLGGISPKDAKGLEQSGNQVISLKTGLGAAMFSVLGDSIHPSSPFADIKVRQAISYAIDGKAMVDALYDGAGITTNQWGVPTNWAFDPTVKGYPYNPDMAKQLLAQAGHPNGFQTKLFGYNTADSMQQMTAVQGFLSKVGIDVQLQPMESAAFKQLQNTGWSDGMACQTIRADSNVVLQMGRVVSSSGVLLTKGIMHPEKIDKLIAQARSAPDQDSRAALTHELQRTIFDEFCIFTPLFVTVNMSVKYPAVHNDGINVTEATEWTPEEAWMG